MEKGILFNSARLTVLGILLAFLTYLLSYFKIPSSISPDLDIFCGTGWGSHLARLEVVSRLFGLCGLDIWSLIW